MSPLIPTLKPRLRFGEAENDRREGGEQTRHQQQVHLDLLSLLTTETSVRVEGFNVAQRARSKATSQQC
jgi:hypothetical protein